MKNYQKINTGQVFAADGDDQVRRRGLDVKSGAAKFNGLAKNFEA